MKIPMNTEKEFRLNEVDKINSYENELYEKELSSKSKESNSFMIIKTVNKIDNKVVVGIVYVSGNAVDNRLTK